MYVQPSGPVITGGTERWYALTSVRRRPYCSEHSRRDDRVWAQTTVRCRKCRALLATSANIVDVEGGPPDKSVDWRSRYSVRRCCIAHASTPFSSLSVCLSVARECVPNWCAWGRAAAAVPSLKPYPGHRGGASV